MSIPQARILTEEELRRFERMIEDTTLPTVVIASIVSLLNSHRSLLSANAELSFENMKLKDVLTDIAEGNPPYAPITIISMKEHYEKLAKSALEELK